MSLVVRVIAPTGRDSDLITKTLQQHGVPAVAADRTTLLTNREEDDSLGPLLIAEEALDAAFIDQLGDLVHKQPAWSDLPILILTGSGRETLQSIRRQTDRLPLGAPVLLERPIRPATLVSSVQAALRARVKQYDVRDAVAQLKAEQETLQVMLDNLPVGVLLAKPSGEIVLANKQLETIMRHPVLPSPDIDSYGNWPAFHLDGRRLEGTEFPLARAMQAGHALPPESYLYQRGDGTKAWISLSAAPILDDHGVVTGGVVAVADIDQQKRSELALIQNEKLAAVGRLAASISHEINNPLEAVTNLLFLAKRSLELTEAKGYLESADQELARVSQIVSHTLRFHRQSTKPTAITAEELLEPTLGLYAARLSNSSIALVVDTRSKDVVTCYEGEIRQVLNNLVGNAIESMKNGGRLTIRSTDTYFWKAGVRGLRITVADTGHGMSREVLRRVFEAFYTTKGINGTGLGLWISHGIVEKHQGYLALRSSDSPSRSGTTFSMFLPKNPFLDRIAELGTVPQT